MEAKVDYGAPMKIVESRRGKEKGRDWGLELEIIGVLMSSERVLNSWFGV